MPSATPKTIPTGASSKATRSTSSLCRRASSAPTLRQVLDQCDDVVEAAIVAAERAMWIVAGRMLPSFFM